jgi:hypothetical protein
MSTFNTAGVGNPVGASVTSPTVNNITINNGIQYKITTNNAVTGSVTLDFSTTSGYEITLTGNATLTFTAPTNTSGYRNKIWLKVKQDATGSRLITFPASVKWAGAAAPVLTTTAAGVDIITFIYDGTNYWGVASLNFA